MSQQREWLAHKASCWHCKREWKKFEDGDMTCQDGVDLLIAARRAAETELVLFEVPPPCVACVGEGGVCRRCKGSGVDPDPAAPVGIAS